jgi:UDP-glucose 4-epimerase
MLRDVAAAHPMSYAVLRYFNVAGGDPQGRYGQSTPAATHLIKVAVQTALGQRPYMEVFGQDFPTKDGTGVRDYIHVSDLARAHSAALRHLQGGGASLTVNCGYGQGFSVNEVVDTVRRVTGVHIEARQAPRRAGDPASIVAGADRIRKELGWVPQLEDLGTIIEHAYKWERTLIERGIV